MIDIDVRTTLTAALDDVTLADPPEAVMRRGNRVRRVRRARRAALGITAGVAAVGLTVTATAPQGGSARIELVAYSQPSVPAALDPVPDGMHLDFDLDGDRLLAMYADPAQPGDRLSLGAGRSPGALDGATSERRSEVRGRPARLLVLDRPGISEDRAMVTWRAEPGRWIALSGRGRFSMADLLLAQAQNVVAEPLPLRMSISFAPDGWRLVGYKSLGVAGSMLAMTDGGDSRGDARRLTVAYQASRYEPIRPALMEDPGPVTPIVVDGEPGQLMEGARGWYASWSTPTGGHLVLQAPKDLTRDQVLVIAEGISLK